jgi:transposase
MRLHGNARLTPFQRELMCVRVDDEGWTAEEAADAAGCSERTCYRWLKRFRAGEPMTDRSSAPHHVANRTPDNIVALIEQLRRLRWTSTEIAAKLALPTSTVCAVLTRLGLQRRSRLEPPEPPNRYCRRHPGELIHIDVKKLGKFRVPGHRVPAPGRGRNHRVAGSSVMSRSMTRVVSLTSKSLRMNGPLPASRSFAEPWRGSLPRA